MPEDTIKLVANETNQAILSLLAIEPSYPRAISELLSLSESDVSRRLKRLEAAGLVEAGWEHVDGKNIKQYRLVVEQITLTLGSQGLTVETTGLEDHQGRRTVVDRLTLRIPEPEGFVGRAKELAAIDGPEPVVTIEGIAGIGKTSLAAAYARSKLDEQPVFFHSFTGTESLTWLLHRWAVFLARHGDDALMDAITAGGTVADQRELLLRAIEERDLVAVFDATDRLRDEDVEAVLREAIERDQAGKLVVTGRTLPRYDPTVDHVCQLRLTGLSQEDVASLLADRDLAADPATAERVHRQLGGHPLATLLLAEAASSAGTPVDELLEGIPVRETETYLLEEVHDQLSESEKRVLAYASIFQGPFTTGDLEAVYPRDPGGALVKLRRRRLLRDDGDSFRIHDLLRSFFHQRLEDPAKVHEKAAEHALTKGTLEARLDALYHLLEAGKRSRVLNLLGQDLDLEEFDLIEEGYHNLYLDVLQQLGPDTLADDQQAGLVQDELGDIRYHRGEHEQALTHYEQAAERFTKADAGDRLADLCWKRALILQEMGEADQASDLVREGLKAHAPDQRTRERLVGLAEDLGLEL